MADDPIKQTVQMMPYGFYAITIHYGDDNTAIWLPIGSP